MAKTTANKVLKIEKSYVRSKPYGDRNTFNSKNGQPWCAFFQDYCFRKAGWDFMKSCPNPAYCPNIETWAKKKGYWKLSGKAGDLVLFDWNSNKSPDHVGMVIKKNSNGTYTTVEGNTSNVSNGNGGCVQIRVREARWILGFVRPPYKGKSKSTKKDTTTTKKKSNKKTYKQTYPKRDYPTLKKHSDGLYLGEGDSGSDVKRLQKFLNWYLGYGLKVDGQFGAMTRRAVIAWQKKCGFTNTGLFGETSLKTAKIAKK